MLGVVLLVIAAWIVVSMVLAPVVGRVLSRTDGPTARRR